MPSFELTLDFEAYCNECGAGICGNVETRKSHRRGLDQITVQPCEKCIANAKEEGAESREREVREELETQIDSLKEELANALAERGTP